MNTMDAIISAEVGKILENWAMMLIEPAERSASIFSSEAPFYIATLDFRGVVNGVCYVVSQRQFGDVLVKNLLGNDDEPDEEAVKDALKEMVNVMTGNLLTVTYGVDNVFELTPPEVHEARQGEIEKIFMRPVFCFIADDNPVGISFSLRL